MIFVTVGTHEQQFNRLIKEVDLLREIGFIKEDVFIQTGYSDYEPKYCEWSKFLKYDVMREYINNARIVITHGGPASFMEVLNYSKVPIVVPRQKRYQEHVNDHQLDFAQKVVEKGYQIKIIDDIKDLKDMINGEFESLISVGSTMNFVSKFNQIMNEMMR